MMKVLRIVVAAVLTGAAVPAWATEGGGGAYPNGAEDFMMGALPPPGQYYINYLLYYGAGDLKDGNGHNMPVNFDLLMIGNVFRLVNVTKVEVLGASWAQHVFLPVMYMDVKTPGGNDDALGIGDVIVDPLILGWHTPEWHVTAGLDIFVPVGKYDKDNLANLGRNYWTIEPAVAVTYRNKDGYEVSAKLMYDLNTRNDDTDYLSGQEFHTDYTVAKHMGDWSVGLGGFCYQQTTGDSGMAMTPGGPADAGNNRGCQYAAGPQVMYSHQGMMFDLKYQKEFETENKPEGSRVWFKCVIGF